jgi:hypothetical protein
MIGIWATSPASGQGSDLPGQFGFGFNDLSRRADKEGRQIEDFVLGE